MKRRRQTFPKKRLVNNNHLIGAGFGIHVRRQNWLPRNKKKRQMGEFIQNSVNVSMTHYTQSFCLKFTKQKQYNHIFQIFHFFVLCFQFFCRFTGMLTVYMKNIVYTFEKNHTQKLSGTSQEILTCQLKWKMSSAHHPERHLKPW